MRQKAFMIFIDNKRFIDRLSYQQAGQLFKALFDYAETGEKPTKVELCGVTEMAFEIFKMNIDKAKSNYESVCKKRAEAGRKGGLAKAKNAKQNVHNSNINNNNKKDWRGIDE